MSGYNKNHREITSLDEIRNNTGIDKMKETFLDLADNNLERAINLVNNKNLKFSTLFLLQQEIQSANILPNLSARNKNALDISNGIILKQFINSQRFSSEYRQDDFTALKWILDTGYIDDGLSEQYDEVIDTTAIILTKIYKDRSCLHTIEELIFKRHRNGAFIYDLVWAYFEVINPEDLFTVVNRLRSNNHSDIELARKFLNFIPCISENVGADPVKQYYCSVRWINENLKYLYYTGETFLQTINPNRYEISLEAKYLQRVVSSVVNADQSRLLAESEYSCLECFKKLDSQARKKLADCSAVLYKRNKNRWSKWIESPVEKQLEIADRILEGS